MSSGLDLEFVSAFEHSGWPPDYIEKCFQSVEAMKGETLSAFCYANAKTLARLAAFMANKGKLGDQ